MKPFAAEKIRNIVLVGHGSSGKTSLAEAALFLSGGTDRLGNIADGNTVFDFDPEEKKRKASVSTAVAPVLWKDVKINVIDTPGLFDFAGGLAEGIRAGDTSVIVLSGKSGVSVGAEKGYAASKGKAKMFFISKLDSENADFYKVFNELTVHFGSSVCPVVIPFVVDRKVKCYVNLIDNKAYTYNKGKRTETEMPEIPRVDEIKKVLAEAVAGTDDELMEKYFMEEPFTYDEMVKGLTKGMLDGSICPVFCGSGQTLEGVDIFLDAVSMFSPSALVAAGEEGISDNGSKEEIEVDENGKPAAIVFKTIADPFVGKLNYFKVIRGKISSESQLINVRTGQTERINKVFVLRGGKQEETEYIGAGDIGAVAKLATVNTGDTLASPSAKVTLKGIDFPKPCLSMSVKPKVKGEEEKIAQGLIRLLEEDLTITFETNNETHQQILSGLGEQHLDVITSKVKQKFGVDILLEIPKVAYRETIRKKVRVEGKHKKQTGGHGQFGHVWIEFEPYDCEELVFEESVFGGAVPRSFFPAVEKGLRECTFKGVLAGYPVVGIKATLVDGSYHPVDSSEMSFKLAAALAYRAGLSQANPVLLEPIGTLKVLLSDSNTMGDIIGEVNKRRGRILGMNPTGDGLQEVAAEVPMAEMGDFSTFLRSATQGRGSYSLDFERYEEAPANIAQKVIAASNEKNGE